MQLDEHSIYALCGAIIRQAVLDYADIGYRFHGNSISRAKHSAIEFLDEMGATDELIQRLLRQINQDARTGSKQHKEAAKAA